MRDAAHHRRLNFVLILGMFATYPATSQQGLTGMTVRAPDGFYDPPSRLPDRPGVLLRSEPLRGVTLPPGMRGWRILYTTTVNAATRATAGASQPQTPVKPSREKIGLLMAPPACAAIV